MYFYRLWSSLALMGWFDDKQTLFYVGRDLCNGMFSQCVNILCNKNVN